MDEDETEDFNDKLTEDGHTSHGYEPNPLMETSSTELQKDSFGLKMYNQHTSDQPTQSTYNNQTADPIVVENDTNPNQNDTFYQKPLENYGMLADPLYKNKLKQTSMSKPQPSINSTEYNYKENEYNSLKGAMDSTHATSLSCTNSYSNLKYNSQKDEERQNKIIEEMENDTYTNSNYNFDNIKMNNSSLKLDYLENSFSLDKENGEYDTIEIKNKDEEDDQDIHDLMNEHKQYQFTEHKHEHDQITEHKDNINNDTSNLQDTQENPQNPNIENQTNDPSTSDNQIPIQTITVKDSARPTSSQSNKSKRSTTYQTLDEDTTSIITTCLFDVELDHKTILYSDIALLGKLDITSLLKECTDFIVGIDFQSEAYWTLHQHFYTLLEGIDGLDLNSPALTKYVCSLDQHIKLKDLNTLINQILSSKEINPNDIQYSFEEIETLIQFWWTWGDKNMICSSNDAIVNTICKKHKALIKYRLLLYDIATKLNRCNLVTLSKKNLAQKTLLLADTLQHYLKVYIQWKPDDGVEICLEEEDSFDIMDMLSNSSDWSSQGEDEQHLQFCITEEQRKDTEDSQTVNPKHEHEVNTPKLVPKAFGFKKSNSRMIEG